MAYDRETLLYNHVKELKKKEINGEALLLFDT